MNEAVQCAVANCPVAKDRRCIEGMTPETCPHFGKPVANAVPVAESETEVEVEVGVGVGVEAESETGVPFLEEGHLPIEDLLSQSGANAHSSAQRTQCIALLGPNEAGKTSLIAAFYDRLQEGRFSGWGYKWCDTLHGFESACHHARLASRRDIPYTERTKLRAGLRYYQLTLRRGADDLNVLFADRAGETYNEAANVAARASEFHELRRADTITMLLDGAKLIHLRQRQNAKSNLTMILQGIVDSGIIAPRPRLAIVLTKFDLVSAHVRAAAAIEEFRKFEGGLRTRFGSHFADVGSFQIASSPTQNGAIERGHGLEALFHYWMADAAPFVANVELKPSLRQFQRLRVVAPEATS